MRAPLRAVPSPLSSQTEASTGDSLPWPPSGPPPGLEQLGTNRESLTTWERSLPPDLEGVLKRWASDWPATFDEILPIRRYDLSRATEGLPEPARLWLMADIGTLLEAFARMAQVTRVRVAFGAIRTDQCRKFHVDYLRYRLITTYVGPGTEWVPEPAVRREALLHPVDCPCDANREIVRDPSQVRRAKAGEVLVMRGAAHGGQGVVHRSPPIEEARLTRVVLVASTVDRPGW